MSTNFTKLACLTFTNLKIIIKLLAIQNLKKLKNKIKNKKEGEPLFMLMVI